jgi:hypothetical protein
MTLNWNYLHKINKKYMDGLISVSRYIEKFYHKEGTPSVIIPPLYDESVDNNYYTSDVTTFVYAGTPFVIKIAITDATYIATMVYPQIRNGVPELRAKRVRESLIMEVMSSKL